MNKLEVFRFLNNLRESGVTNMFGATPYIQDEFDCTKSEASAFLSEWMENFDPTGEYEKYK